MNKPLALYPGSFDPVTRGHEDIVARASEQFDLRVGVAVNPGKSPAFTLQERVRLIQGIVPKYEIDALSVVRIPGSTARWMKRYAVNTIVRGKRNIIDELGEKELEYFNKLEYSDLETETLDASEALQFASSSASKNLMKANHDPSSVIALDVQEALTSRLLSQYPVYITGGMGAGKSTIARALQDEARTASIPTRYIELDKVAHDIYASLDEPYYANIRQQLRATFGDDIAPDGNWIDRKILRQKLTDTSGNVDKSQFAKLDTIMGDAIEFRYRDMIEGFKGIILIDGIMKEGFTFSRLAHHNTLIVDAKQSVRAERVKKRYEANGDTKADDTIINSIISIQPNKGSMLAMMKRRIAEEGHGSVEMIQNDTHSINTRNTFFQLLNQIDRYGELRATWILSRLGIQGNMREHLNFLQSRYNEPHRYYHTWEHIVESLTTLFQMAIELDIPDDEVVTIGAAILGHDLVYDVDTLRYRTNESNSARTWVRYLEQHGVNLNQLEDIEDLIKETRHGRAHVPDRLISQVMHDVDMAILGSPWSRYRIYKSDIPSEHSSTLSGGQFRKLRLEKFLLPLQQTGTSLYKTEWAADRLTANLIANIRREIAGLS